MTRPVSRNATEERHRAKIRKEWEQCIFVDCEACRDDGRFEPGALL